jgi:hypothetical protein
LTISRDRAASAAWLLKRLIGAPLSSGEAPHQAASERGATEPPRFVRRPTSRVPGADHEVFKSFEQAERFLTVQVANLFHIRYPASTTAADRGTGRERAFAIWYGISEIGPGL